MAVHCSTVPLPVASITWPMYHCPDTSPVYIHFTALYKMAVSNVQYTSGKLSFSYTCLTFLRCT